MSMVWMSVVYGPVNYVNYMDLYIVYVDLYMVYAFVNYMSMVWM